MEIPFNFSIVQSNPVAFRIDLEMELKYIIKLDYVHFKLNNTHKKQQYKSK